MLERLQRHPIPMAAHFRHSLVLTYAFPRPLLERLLPPPLELDTYGERGFVAVALVQTEGLRPSFAPRVLGRDFFLCGYRIFVRLRGAESLRGLYILRSDTDRRSMAVLGNLFTHYRYRKADVSASEEGGFLEIRVTTPDGEADLHVRADLSSRPAPLPEESPFATLIDARRYAGPLPHTFDYEPASDSVLVVRGVRSHWEPQTVGVDVQRATFLERPPFAGVEPLLSNAFYVGDVDYRWERARVLAGTPSSAAA